VTSAGVVQAIGTAETDSGRIVATDRATVAVARGIEGDRYAEDRGHFKGFPDQEITLIEAEDAESAGFSPLELRRNIVTRGVRLEELIGRTFRIGTAAFAGIRPCDPCGHVEGLVGRPVKGRVRGGLRARVVRGGTIALGDAVEVVPATIDADMRAVIESAHLAFVATVTPGGRPNLSPKGTLRVLDDHRLFYVDIASPQTRANLRKNPWMEINVVDTTSRRGYRFLGQAQHHPDGPLATAAVERVMTEEGHVYPNRGIVVLTVEQALPLLSPGYGTVFDERELRAHWKERRPTLDRGFESHIAAREPEPGWKEPTRQAPSAPAKGTPAPARFQRSPSP
jgi:MOSC domain-containing protein YiiM